MQEDSTIAVTEADAHETLADILREWKLVPAAAQAKAVRDWTLIEGGKQEEEVAQDPVLKTMVAAGRQWLEANPTETASDYRIRFEMKSAAPTHSADQQRQALNLLKTEYRERAKA